MTYMPIFTMTESSLLIFELRSTKTQKSLNKTIFDMTISLVGEVATKPQSLRNQRCLVIERLFFGLCAPTI